MKFVLIGGVRSTAVALDSLLSHSANVVGVLGYRPAKVQSVSGYVDVVDHAKRSGVKQVAGFTRVNDSSTVDALQAWAPDFLLVVGLSQIVSRRVRETATRMAVGFHPTLLPRGRGRAPIAWLVLKQEQGAATLFRLSDKADEGEILTQVPYPVGPRDHAVDVMDRCMEALDQAVGKFVHDVESGSLNGIPQDHSRATFWGARRPEDGRIDWNTSPEEVDALVRATAEPHPGAYSVTPDGAKIIFMRSGGPDRDHTGVPGRLLAKRDEEWLVACGEGAVWLGAISSEQQDVGKMRVGDLVGYRLADVDQFFR